MTTISDYLEAERIDPSLPRDAFVPPADDDDLDDLDDLGVAFGPGEGGYDE